MRLLRFAGRCVRFIFTFVAAVLPSLIRDSIGIAGATLLVYGTWLIYRPAGIILAGLLLMLVAVVMARRAE